MSEIAQLADFLDQMVQTYGLAQVAKGIGQPVGADLETDVSQLTGEIAYRFGVGSDFFETGNLGAIVAARAKQAQTWLRAKSGPFLAKARNNIGLLMAVGATYAAYSWATQDERIKIAEIESKAEIAKLAIAENPKAAATFLKNWSGSTLGGIPTSTIVLIGLGVVTFGIAYKWFGT